MKNKRIVFVFLFACILAGIVLVVRQKISPQFECTDAIGCVNIASGEPVKLGVLQAISGKVASLGIEQIRGIELAMGKRDNQLLGHPIELEIEDTGCSEEGGANAALRIVSDPQIVAIIGTSCSSAGAGASSVMSEAGFVMISGANSAASLTSKDGKQGSHWRSGYFRTRFSDEDMVRAPVLFAFRELGVRKVATINQGDSYTRGLTELFENMFTQLGGKVVLNAIINKGDTDMRPVLTGVGNSGAELLFFPVYRPEGDYIIQHTREMKGGILREDIILMGATALISDGLIKTTGKDGIGMYFAGHAQPEGLSYDQLISEYRSRYGELPVISGFSYAYDATNMLLTAIENVAIKNKNGSLHIGRRELRNVMYQVSEFEGITGKLTCDTFGDCGNARFIIMRLDDPGAGLEGLRSNVVYTYEPGKQALSKEDEND